MVRRYFFTLFGLHKLHKPLNVESVALRPNAIVLFSKRLLKYALRAQYLILIVICCLGCFDRTKIEKADKATQCPEGYWSNSSRESTIINLLHAKARSTTITLPSDVSICFSHDREGVVHQNSILLPEHASDACLAARVGHLIEHIKQKQLFDNQNSQPCDSWLQKIFDAEFEAHFLEYKLSQELGCTEMAFNPDLTNKPSEARVRAMLKEHLEKTGTELMSSYRLRCNASVNSAASH